MPTLLQLALIGFLAFASCHYTLSVSGVRNPLTIIIAAIFAVLVMVFVPHSLIV